jgi:hypothetical protein
MTPLSPLPSKADSVPLGPLERLLAALQFSMCPSEVAERVGCGSLLPFLSCEFTASVLDASARMARASADLRALADVLRPVVESRKSPRPP